MSRNLEMMPILLWGPLSAEPAIHVYSGKVSATVGELPCAMHACVLACGWCKTTVKISWATLTVVYIDHTTVKISRAHTTVKISTPSPDPSLICGVKHIRTTGCAQWVGSLVGRRHAVSSRQAGRGGLFACVLLLKVVKVPPLCAFFWFWGPTTVLSALERTEHVGTVPGIGHGSLMVRVLCFR